MSITSLKRNSTQRATTVRFPWRLRTSRETRPSGPPGTEWEGCVATRTQVWVRAMTLWGSKDSQNLVSLPFDKAQGQTLRARMENLGVIVSVVQGLL